MAAAVAPPMGTTLIHPPSPESDSSSENDEQLSEEIIATLRDAVDILAKNQPVPVKALPPSAPSVKASPANSPSVKASPPSTSSTKMSPPNSPPKKRGRFRSADSVPTEMKRPDPRDATCEELRRYEEWRERQITELWRRERPFRTVFEKWGAPMVPRDTAPALPPHDYSTDYNPMASPVYRLKKMFGDVVIVQ